ncbi:hypothetical protein AM588_10003661 [Phytophthora nicotianae]|uniref:Uncharacterized protein n=1 Tax=Phytophthora nicotianae TaxID=4792 RepID=A0A0W8D6X4_PHYNI|nr:hypothetical protein AM588_10003661 [Phytophthora nicotianae]
MDLESLYERVLRSVPENCLQDSYNDVLKEEILLIDRAVSDVSAAFAKLEEIRDAMDKLGNGSTGSRSASLVKIMENTRKMQCELNTKLDKVISGMMATGQKRKRELETESPKGTVKLPPRMIGETGKSQTWSGTLSKDNCLDEMRKLTQMTVLERNEHVPVVLLQLRNIICEISAGPPPKKLPAYYAIMLNDVKQVPIQLRAPCVSHALLLLKKAMMTDAVGEQKADISDSIGGVLDWITESSDLEHDFELYHDFAIVLFSYTLQHPETEELQR